MQKDILGKALLDYFHNRYTEDIITETDLTEEDELPLPHLFRNYNEMPAIEKQALELTKGNVLDIGCGAGSHSVYLQNEKNLKVTSIDISEGAVEVCKLRGLKDVRNIDLLDLKGETFDTLLLLMNGSGIFKTLEEVPAYLQHLKSLLSPQGQILMDSTDIKYLYDSDEDGSIWIPEDKAYYGELRFTMRYKGEVSEEFPWLYLDFNRLRLLCKANQLSCKLILKEKDASYLVKIY